MGEQGRRELQDWREQSLTGINGYKVQWVIIIHVDLSQCVVDRVISLSLIRCGFSFLPCHGNLLGSNSGITHVP